jgi:hypothetical protein
MMDEIDPGQPFLRVNILRWREIFRMIGFLLHVHARARGNVSETLTGIHGRFLRSGKI